MATRNRTWLFLSFCISLSIHIAAVSPFSQWLEGNLRPRFYDEGLEIELQDSILAEEKKIVEESEVETVRKRERTETEPFEEKPPNDEDIEYIEKKLPDFKKNLSLESAKDRLILPESEDAGVADAEGASDKEKKESIPQDLIDRIFAERPDRPVANADIPKKGAERAFPPFAQEERAARVAEELPKLRIAEEEGEREKEIPAVSLLFLPETERRGKSDDAPEEVRRSFRGVEPERTNEEQVQYSLNTYRWSFERYMENWAVDIVKWWRAPLDYTLGKMPEGGHVWVRVRLDRAGKLIEYRVFPSRLSAEMELRVVQALIGSLERPALPDSFPNERLEINWKFIYPAIRPNVDMRR